jgi:hypothetical protein
MRNDDVSLRRACVAGIESNMFVVVFRAVRIRGLRSGNAKNGENEQKSEQFSNCHGLRFPF